MIHTDEQLQKLANRKNSFDLIEAADLSRSIDNDDTASEAWLDGMTEILEQLEKNPGAQVWKVNFGEYVDDDGIAIFLGTRESVETRIKALEDGEDNDE